MKQTITLFSYLVVLIAMLAFASSRADTEIITVYKTPSCGCCKGWVDYLQEKGFIVETYDMDVLTDIKAKYGLTDNRLMSCHTAIIDGYVVEGHVPVQDIRRLIAESPDIVGSTAPGMPQLSPGIHSRPPPKITTF